MLLPPPPRRSDPSRRFCAECSFRLSKKITRGLGLFVVVPVFCNPLTRNRRLADAVPTPDTSNSHFSRNSQAKSLVLASNFATWHFPLAYFFLTPPRNSSISLQGFLTPIRGTFYGLSCAILGPSWGRLGPSWGPSWVHSGPSWGRTPPVQHPARSNTSGSPIASIEVTRTFGSPWPVCSPFLCLHRDRFHAVTARMHNITRTTSSALLALGFSIAWRTMTVPATYPAFRLCSQKPPVTERSCKLLMPLVDLSQWHALLLSAALIWAGVPPTVRVQAPPAVHEAFAAGVVPQTA